MFSFTRASVFALVAAAASVSAQTVPNITLSKECASTLFNLAFSPEAASCFNTPDLINAVINKTQTANDPIGAATTWINGLCSNGWCSENDLQGFIQNVTAGCSADLQNAGLKTDITPDLLANVRPAYRAARDILCLKDTSTGDLCAIDTIKQGEAFVQQNFLSIQTVYDLFTGGRFNPDAAQTFLQTTLLPNAHLACTDCAKAAFSVAKGQFPALISQQDKVSDVCGADFVNGETPADIQNTAKNASAASLLAKNAASTVFGRVSGIQVGAVALAAALGLLL